MAKYNRIFAALDGGDTQEAVARRSLSIAHDNHAEVLLGHVLDDTLLQTGGVGAEGIAETKKDAIEKALERYLTRAEQDECVPAVEVKVAAGKVEEAMVEELIKPFEPDLVICGVRGLSNIKYAFVGSVSTYLVRHMDCDVLVVRPEAIEQVDDAEYAHLGIE